MDSRKKRELEKEKARLEALQNTEKKFLKGTFGDFFGKKESGSGGTKAENPEMSFGSGNKSTKAEAGGSSPAKEKTGTADLSFGDGFDELEAKGREITSQLNARTDALQRANDALKEVQALLDNPLYDGMPSVTGRGTSGKGASPDTGKKPVEIDPGLMAGSDGDLFSGLAGGGNGSGGAGGTSGSSFDDPMSAAGDGFAQGISGQQAAQQAQPGEKEKEKEPEKDP